MVYSTCSFCYEEDEGVLLSFLAKHKDMHASKVEKRPGYFHGEAIPESVYLFPSLYQGEGQFFCLLQKDGEAPLFKKETPNNIGNDEFFSFFGLEGRYNFAAKEALWSLPFYFPISDLSILRAGLKVASSPFDEPDHALAHYLDPSFQIELDENRAIRFLKGETFPMALGDGYYLASYEGKGLGFFKMVKGQMKNHYPKGLRRTYRLI